MLRGQQSIKYSNKLQAFEKCLLPVKKHERIGWQGNENCIYFFFQFVRGCVRNGTCGSVRRLFACR